MESDLKSLKIKAQKEIEKSDNLKELNQIFKKYLGKRGELSLILRSLAKMSAKKRKKIGKEANELKRFLKAKIEKKMKKMRLIGAPTEEAGWIDITVPGEKPALGHLHPLTQVKREAMLIFQEMGFEVVEGPEIESEWYNFDALNIPKDHPARDEWNSLWVKSEGKKLLLRTHTSPVQIRYMEKHNPPLRIIVPGDCFRAEATDASHEFQFAHIEGLMVDKEISVANFKAVIKTFFQRFFKKPVKVLLKPDFFPFTEPSFEVDITCLACGGKGCKACQKTGFMEIMGAGMVHPAVFKICGLNPKNWQGFAFGIGWDRLAMMRYKIDDIRLLRSGDLRFLQQF